MCGRRGIDVLDDRRHLDLAQRAQTPRQGVLSAPSVLTDGATFNDDATAAGIVVLFLIRMRICEFAYVWDTDRPCPLTGDKP